MANLGMPFIVLLIMSMLIVPLPSLALDMLFTTAMLEGDFAELEVQLCVTEEAVLDEGPYHQGRAELTRLVARRPL